MAHSSSEQGKFNLPQSLDGSKNASDIKQIDYAVLVFEKATYATIKLSVLFFFRRIFGTNKTFRFVTNALIVLITLWGIIFLFTDVFICGAESHLGHPCAANEWVSLWFAITDVIGDLLILPLPYPMIRRLQMDRREKIGIAAVFMLGFLYATPFRT